MTSNELKIKIARVLGVSGSEKELAYEILLGKISEQLQPNLTLKIPSIGFFQLKTSGRTEVTETADRDSIVFIPFSSELSKDSENLYLILEVAARRKNSMEFDSSVFSIGVGKPLVPLYNKDEFKDSETSYAILRKSIEERVNELISESSQIENFNMWDGLIESTSKQAESPSQHEDTLKALTSDLDFDVTNDNVHDDSAGMEDEPNLDDLHIDMLTASLLMDEELSPKKESAKELPADEKLAGEEEKTAAPEDKESEPEEIQESAKVEEEVETQLPAVPEEKIDEIKEKIISESTEDAKENSSWNFNTPAEEEEKVEWNWGDNLKEEFGVGAGKEEDVKYDIVDEELELDETAEEEMPSVDRKSTRDLFAELDSTIKKELTSEIQFEPELQTTRPRSKRYDFVEDKTPYDREEYVPPTLVSSREYTRHTRTEAESYDVGKYSSLSKSIFIVFSAFVVVAALILYFFVFSKESVKTTPQNAETASAAQSQTDEPPVKIGTAQPAESTSQPVVLPEEDNFPRTAEVEVKDKDLAGKTDVPLNVKSVPAEVKPKSAILKEQASVEPKTQPAETKVGNSIFFDGSKYSVQISSWRNKLKADQEVARLKKLGYDAFEYRVNIPQKGGIWYRVRIGNFKSKEEAEQSLIKNNF